MKTVAQVILEARERKGWTQQELAVHCGVSNSKLSNINNGGSASLKILARIAETLELPLDWLRPALTAETRGGKKPKRQFITPSDEVIALLKKRAPERLDFVKLARKVGHDILSAANYHEGHVDIAAMDLEDPSKED